MVTMNRTQTTKQPLTTYNEKKIGKILYRVTSVYLGKVELGKALEDLAVQKIVEDNGVSERCLMQY